MHTPRLPLLLTLFQQGDCPEVIHNLSFRGVGALTGLLVAPSPLMRAWFSGSSRWVGCSLIPDWSRKLVIRSDDVDFPPFSLHFTLALSFIMPRRKKWRGRPGPGRGHIDPRTHLQAGEKLVVKTAPTLLQQTPLNSAAPLPISDTKEPSQKPTPGRPPTYTIDDRILLALMLGKYSISSRAGVQIHRFLKKLEKAVSPHTALRSLVEAHVCCDIEISRLLATSIGLFIGIDGSSTGTQRSFLEIEFGGINDKGPWNHLVEFSEETGGGAQHELVRILTLIDHYAVLQGEVLGLTKTTNLTDFGSVIFDNTSSNTDSSRIRLPLLFKGG